MALLEVLNSILLNPEVQIFLAGFAAERVMDQTGHGIISYIKRKGINKDTPEYQFMDSLNNAFHNTCITLFGECDDDAILDTFAVSLYKMKQIKSISALQYIFEEATGQSVDDSAINLWIAHLTKEISKPSRAWLYNFVMLNSALNNDKIKTANKLYAQAFEEIMFLHKYKDTKIRLRDLFVEHKYAIIDYGYGEVLELDTKVELLDYIKEFLVNHEKIPNILFIEGNAGLGKSSLVSYLAYLYENGSDLFGTRELICVRLRDIIPPNTRFDYDSINLAILKYLNISSPELFQELYTNAVCILDGFDELCMVEKISENVEQYIYDLNKLFANCKIIITSRPQYLKVKGINLHNYHIMLRHFDKGQRDIWIAKYRDICTDPAELYALGHIANIEEEDTVGICDTPMALYMLAAGKINEAAKHNHWALYNQIFNRELTETEYNTIFPATDGVYRHAISKYNELLYRLGSEIAYSMYKNNNAKLFLYENEIQAIVDDMDISDAGVKDIVERCFALCSYWKANENKGAVEFYHNNIRDFFMCEKIFYEMDRLYSECFQKSNEQITKVIVERLYELFHHFEINEKVIEFLYLRVLYQKENPKTDNFAKAEQTAKYLPVFFNAIVNKDISAKIEDALISTINVYSNTVQIYRHAYEPYLNESNTLIDWVPNGCNYLIRKHIVKQIFIKTPLTIKDKIIYTMGKAIFDNTDFSGADLRFAGCAGSSIKFSNLSNTILLSSDFEGSDLSRTEFINADLRHAKLLACNLMGCDFSDANLSDTILPDGYSSSNSTEVKMHLKELKIEELVV